MREFMNIPELQWCGKAWASSVAVAPQEGRANAGTRGQVCRQTQTQQPPPQRPWLQSPHFRNLLTQPTLKRNRNSKLTCSKPEVRGKDRFQVHPEVAQHDSKEELLLSQHRPPDAGAPGASVSTQHCNDTLQPWLHRHGPHTHSKALIIRDKPQNHSPSPRCWFPRSENISTEGNILRI